jgi:hypothetical protein
LGQKLPVKHDQPQRLFCRLDFERGHRAEPALLGSALVDQKTNDIPVARELFDRLELQERLVTLDALHTQDETARALVLQHGTEYLLTVREPSHVRAQIQTLVS